MGYNIKFEDNSNQIKGQWKGKKEKITYAMGLLWQSISTKIITSNGIVDTGKLRGSLTFITNNKIGKSISKVKENEADDFLRGSSGSENDLIVGSNVSYAQNQELNNRKGAFIRPAITEYREDYENVAKSIMKGN